ncbi:hypothetical protein AB0B31_11535 [Catellatospora citrea]|uniref:hypothetical protein n=1 Tax=Catellatospora citrea TaxID=53366 RepID=UPI0033EF424B
MGTVIHRSHGIPLEAYELTKADHRAQSTSDRIGEAAAAMTRSEQAQEAADPELARRRVESTKEALLMIFSHRTPDRDLMRWRFRLYCGHIMETTWHRETERPTSLSSQRCPQCGKDPAVIVAYEPLGLVDEPPSASPGPAVPPRLTRTQLERRIKDLEGQLAEVCRGEQVVGPQATDDAGVREPESVEADVLSR